MSEEKDIIDDAVVLTMMVTSIEKSNDGVNELYDLVCRGRDGEQPILVRVSMIEKLAGEHNNRISAIEGLQLQFKIEDRKSQWKFLGIFVISIMGWATALLTNPNTTNSEIFLWILSLLR